MAKMSSDKKFIAYVYKDDYKEMQKLVQQYPNIETGGDLFGLWHDNKSVVIQLFIGPGKKCRRTTTSFHQDTDYLYKVGSIITTEEGLCNVGEWHSHHQIGMPQPSRGDRQTVLSNMPNLGLDRFVLFIASIESKPGETRNKRSHNIELDQIKLRSFIFRRELPYEKQPIEGEIVILEGQNPIRSGKKAGREIKQGAESQLEHEEGPEKKRPQEKQRVKPGPYHPNNENMSPNIRENQTSFPGTGSAAAAVQYGQQHPVAEQDFQGFGKGFSQQRTSRQIQTQQHDYRNPSPQTSPQYDQAQVQSVQNVPGQRSPAPEQGFQGFGRGPHQHTTSRGHGIPPPQTSHQYSQSQTNVQNVPSHQAAASRQDWTPPPHDQQQQPRVQRNPDAEQRQRHGKQAGNSQYLRENKQENVPVSRVNAKGFF